ncbi:uncharacterized protein J3R85_007706 [Psidium guajava]|nr:uncharacterized protein J3R85_007706 [Psidium guajava]
MLLWLVRWIGLVAPNQYSLDDGTESMGENNVQE